MSEEKTKTNQKIKDLDVQLNTLIAEEFPGLDVSDLNQESKMIYLLMLVVLNLKKLK